MSSLPLASSSSTLMRIPTFDLEEAPAPTPARGAQPRPLVLEFGVPGPSGQQAAMRR